MGTLCPIQCLDHMFSLKPLSMKCQLKGETNINYCPICNEQDREFNRSLNIVPIFNNDCQPSLPGFILEYDKIQYQSNFEKYQDDHHRKILEYTAKKKELLFPRPNKRYRYCGVCKQNYDEYKDDHRDKFTANRYVLKIEKFIRLSSTTQDDPNQISDQYTSSRIQMSSTQLVTQKSYQAQLEIKKRGRPKLTEAQKQKNKEERLQRKLQGLEPLQKKKIKTNKQIPTNQQVLQLSIL